MPVTRVLTKLDFTVKVYLQWSEKERQRTRPANAHQIRPETARDAAHTNRKEYSTERGQTKQSENTHTTRSIHHPYIRKQKVPAHNHTRPIARKAPMADNRVEKAFQLIQQGNESKKEGELWQASDSFCQARDLLKTLFEENSAADDDNGESSKIASLYQQQSQEYLREARTVLIEALAKENSSAANKSDQDDLSDDEALSRVDLFAQLFSKPLSQLSPSLAATNADADEQQASLEERLQQLNASIPQAFKTSDERMHNGVSGEKTNGGDDPEDAGVSSASDYLRGILADEDEEGGVDSEIDDDAADDASIPPEVVEGIADKVADAQATLAELMAILNERGNDESSDPVLLDRSSARLSLKKARLLLLQASKQLVES